MLKKMKSLGNQLATSLTLALIVAANAAADSPSIGNGGGTLYTKFTAWLQNFSDFITGPFGIAVVIISVVLAFAAWAFAPKDGIMGPLVRIVTAGIAIINVSTILISFS
jgi:type IV secretory pathway VirB2 component (pilin)